MTPPQRPDQAPENHNDGAMDLAYGGLSLSARGSIVVLVVLMVVNAGLTLWVYSLINMKINDVVVPQDRMLADIIGTAHKHRGEQGSEFRTVRDDIIRNRDYLREVARTCLLTNDQKVKFQQHMSPALKELLQRDYLLEK